jgi:benzil reductase ((S)-benzoin forming)
MENGFFLITGTSRGLGEAVARTLLDAGNTVLGVSRTPSTALESRNFHDLPFDLTATSRLGEITNRAGEIFRNGNFDFACLVNNASAVDPLGPIENCPAAEIEAHMKIGLIAPMILTSLFIRKFTDEAVRRKVAFVSSGAAFTALPDESIYCSAKAGMNMLAECVGREQGDNESGFEIVSIGPGMVDTYMQEALRAPSEENFAMANMFQKAFEDGRLQDPRKIAAKVCKVLTGRSEQGKFVDATALS